MNIMLSYKNKTKIKFYKIYTWFVILMPIINIYASPIPRIGLGEFIFLACFPFLLLDIIFFSQNKLVKESSMYLIYFSYCIMISFVICLFQYYYSITDICLKLLRDSVYICIFLICSQFYFDFKYAIKILKFVVVLVSTYLVLQYLFYNIFGIVLPSTLKNVTLNYSITNSNEQLARYERMYSYGSLRLPSIFLEPAHFAQYVSLGLIVFLFDKKLDRRNVLLSLYISLAVMLSTSAIGVATILAIWVIWVFSFNASSKNGIKNVTLMCCIITMAVIFIYLYNVGNEFVHLIDRFQEIDSSSKGVTSGGIRVSRGFNIFSQLDFIYKFFGVGYGNYDCFSKIHHIITLFDAGTIEVNDYMSSISYILVSGGVVAFSLYLVAIFKFFRSGNKIAKVAIVILLLMMFGASIYSTPIYAMYMSFIVNSKRK